MALLVEAGVAPPRIFLDHAITSLDCESRTSGSADADPKIVAPLDPGLVRAIGGGFAIMATIMARSDLVSLEELGRLFGEFASISAHDDAAMGSIMAGWGGMILHAARDVEGAESG
ncbi:hypothetical protein [Sphingomonas sp. GM_Shp_2]|uniref:hypothetical protein n=1 Tax=Sphingomonas sp. GM_Shp_2 TaxID=2937380 RepID=UPI00226ABC58|nr:hypothetical protein [Sphingomonas sp. GM_Shp_2]